MCIIMPSYKNVDHDRYLWSIESILQQNYTNYRVVIIDDQSPDGTLSHIVQHLRWRGTKRDRVILLNGTKNQGAMANIAYGTHKYCNFGEVHLMIDGDDEIIGRQVFKVLNAVYQ